MKKKNSKTKGNQTKVTDREGQKKEQRELKKGGKRSNEKEREKEKKKMITETQITSERKIKI